MYRSCEIIDFKGVLYLQYITDRDNSFLHYVHLYCSIPRLLFVNNKRFHVVQWTDELILGR